MQTLVFAKLGHNQPRMRSLVITSRGLHRIVKQCEWLGRHLSKSQQHLIFKFIANAVSLHLGLCPRWCRRSQWAITQEASQLLFFRQLASRRLTGLSISGLDQPRATFITRVEIERLVNVTRGFDLTRACVPISTELP